jgi:hypothetical protein
MNQQERKSVLWLALTVGCALATHSQQIRPFALLGKEITLRRTSLHTKGRDDDGGAGSYGYDDGSGTGSYSGGNSNYYKYGYQYYEDDDYSDDLAVTRRSRRGLRGLDQLSHHDDDDDDDENAGDEEYYDAGGYGDEGPFHRCLPPLILTRWAVWLRLRRSG